ncbi:Myosin-4 [Sesbania bispinosa]|nr:Myosin-4 [Sesbania bispinosa]
MAEGNSMAELSRIKLERQQRNLVTPPPTNLTLTSTNKGINAEEIGQPGVVVPPKDTKKTIASGKGGPTKDPKVGSGAVDLDKKKKRGNFSKGEVRGVVNHLLYSRTDNPFWKEQSPLGISRLISCRALQIASATRYMEEYFLPTFQEVENERQATVEENRSLLEQNKELGENLTKIVAELDALQEASKNEKYFKALANKENNDLEKSNVDLKFQIKDAEDSYIEAKAETDKAKIDLENALKEFEETKAMLQKFESDLKNLNEKYDNTITKLGIKAYANTIEQLMVLNPGLNPYGYVVNGVIMEDSINGPIPFVPREEVIGDSNHAPNQGFKLNSEKKVEEQVPSSTQLPPSKEDPEVASKDETIHLD